MGYITTVITPEERRKAGPKNGAQATATISLDPGGAVSVHVASVPQGQGHRTVVAQIAADALGLSPRTFASSPTWTPRATPGRSPRATTRAVSRPRSAARCSLPPSASRTNSGAPPPGNSTCRRTRSSSRAAVCVRKAIPTTRCRCRVAAAAHWAPGTLADDNQAIRETVFWTPPQLTAPTEEDGINSSLCHGFIFDFCGLEVDRVTGAVRIDKYVTMHDCGRVCIPAWSRAR